MTSQISDNHDPKVFLLCPKAVQNLKTVSKLSQSCPKSVPKLFQTCPKLVQNLFQICPQRFSNMSLTCAQHVPKIFKTCQSQFIELKYASTGSFIMGFITLRI